MTTRTAPRSDRTRIDGYAVPLLPFVDLDDGLSFYEAMGFRRTYRQVRPNPFGTVVRDAIELHLFVIEGFDPQDSYGGAVIVVDDLDGWYRDWADGFRHRYGKLLSAGIPRILRPRKRQGDVRGFTVVDPGGNWLRFSQLGDTSPSSKSATGLSQVIENAARLGDSHGDVRRALALLTAGLDRHPGARAVERVRAQLYAAELAARLDDPAARRWLDRAHAIELTAADATELDDDFRHADEIVATAFP